MAAHPIVVQSRRAVIGGLAAGKSKSQVARETGRSRKTVRIWQ
jgi:DNA-binding NarL/FixJ family response regulator